MSTRFATHPHVPPFRWGWAIVGVTLIAFAVPLFFLLGAMTIIVSFLGASALTFALAGAGYPLLGAAASFGLAWGVFWPLALFLK